MRFRVSLLTAGALLVILAVAGTVYASHSWGGYHWARKASPFTLKAGDNVSSVWDAHLATAASDWSQSSVLDMTVVPGQGRKTCRPTGGRVEVCNSKYGNNGWLGVAQIWVNGTHITQGIVKLNDTYFNTPTYNSPAWRNMVMCQEVGHTLGLDHQDENFNNPPLGTCMDYTSDPTPNQHPNQHDYDQLEAIYAHLDTINTVYQSTARANFRSELDRPEEWGERVHRANAGREYHSLYERDLGHGEKVFTFVVWADQAH